MGWLCHNPGQAQSLTPRTQSSIDENVGAIIEIPGADCRVCRHSPSLDQDALKRSPLPPGARTEAANMRSCTWTWRRAGAEIASASLALKCHKVLRMVIATTQPRSVAVTGSLSAPSRLGAGCQPATARQDDLHLVMFIRERV